MDENIITLTPLGYTPNPNDPNKEKDTFSLSHINIKKYPYNGKAKNLIDKFLIIGYDSKCIEKTINLIYEKNIINSTSNPTQPIEVTLNEVPSIINEICYDYSNESLDNDLILELLFPNSPLIYFIKTPNNKNTVFPTTSIVFSLNPFDEGNSKKSINGFGYQFYEIEKIQNSVVCFPKIICFLSEFPYFSAYHNLSQKILKLFKNNSLSFPIEALFYNIVNFIPSPINYSIDLSIWKVADVQVDERARKGSASSGNSSVIISSPQKSVLQPKQAKSDNTIFFPQLSGYPLLNFNLSMIFNILPVDIIMQVFFVTFLENDIIFYSSNLELLNLTMFIFSNLNYPCNDSIYFWHILSVSPNSFMNSSSTFVGKTCSCMIGINAPYDPKLRTTLRIKEHFVIDLDNKIFTYASESTSPETTRMKNLLDTLLKIVRVQTPTNPNEQGKICEALRTLYLTLTTFSKKFIFMAHGVTGQKENAFIFDTFKYDAVIAKHNKSIQEAFYTFIITVFNYYYSSFKLGFDLEQPSDVSNVSHTQFSSSNKVIKSTIKNTSVYVEYHVEKETVNDFEKDFHLKFKESSKFGTYIINFMLYYDTIDLFKIPLLFTEEFNSRMQFNKNNDSRRKITNYLDIIDQLYYLQTPDDLYKISSQKGIKSNIKEINFNEFYAFSDKNLRSDFLRHGMVSEFFDRMVVGGIIRPCYKKYEIDPQYLLDYIYTLNNLTQDELVDVFPMINLIENNDIISFKQDSISDVVEQSLISQKAFEKLELIVYSIFNVFAATRGLCEAQDAVLEILLLTDISNKTKYNLRKYLTRIINIYARFALKAAREENETERVGYIYCYRILVKYLQNNDILPNEELMALLNINSIKNSNNNTTINYSTRGSEDPSFSGIMHRNHELKPHFEYTNLDDYFLEKTNKENETNLWTLSDNLGFDGNISQPELELLEGEGNLNDSSSIPDHQQKDIVIKSTIEGRDDITPLNICYYSPKKLYTESSKLLDKYYFTLDNNDIDKEVLNHLMWNLIYYIYLIQKIDLQKQIDFPCEISKAFITIYKGMTSK